MKIIELAEIPEEGVLTDAKSIMLDRDEAEKLRRLLNEFMLP